MTSLPKIVGFSGPKGAGKTTAANVLVSEFGYVRMSFADPLRDMLKAIGITPEEMADRDLKETPHTLLCGKSPRQALQSLGTEWGRLMIGENIWVNAALARAMQSSARVVFDDVRFNNEASAIIEAGGIVCEIRRHGYFYGGHLSEQGIDSNAISANIFGFSEPSLCEAVRHVFKSTEDV